MAKKKNIALIGPRGCGKTYVSLLLSQSLKQAALSLDTLISYEANGKSIPDILAEHNGNWNYFREMEYKVLAKATSLEQVIIDCGGGIVIDLDPCGEEIFSQRKAILLQKHAKVFFLRAPTQQSIEKMSGNEHRPALSRDYSAEEIYRKRLPMYERIADYEIRSGRGMYKAAAKKIIDTLRSME